MKTKKKKQKKVKSETEYIKAWKAYVKREESFLDALLRKRHLECQLSSVRIELIDMCIDSATRSIINGNKKLKDVTDSKNIKTAKRKRIVKK